MYSVFVFAQKHGMIKIKSYDNENVIICVQIELTMKILIVQ